MAVATGSQMEEYRLKMTNYSDLASCFSHIVTADNTEVKRGKPAPDIFLVAAKKFKSPPKSNDQVRLLLVHYYIGLFR